MSGKHPANDPLLQAIQEERDDEPAFGASSAAVQAANAVLLANMRSKLGNPPSLATPMMPMAVKPMPVAKPVEMEAASADTAEKVEAKTEQAPTDIAPLMEAAQAAEEEKPAQAVPHEAIQEEAERKEADSPFAALFAETKEEDAPALFIPEPSAVSPSLARSFTASLEADEERVSLFDSLRDAPVEAEAIPATPMPDPFAGWNTAPTPAQRSRWRLALGGLILLSLGLAGFLLTQIQHVAQPPAAPAPMAVPATHTATPVAAIPVTTTPEAAPSLPPVAQPSVNAMPLPAPVEITSAPARPPVAATPAAPVRQVVLDPQRLLRLLARP